MRWTRQPAARQFRDADLGPAIRKARIPLTTIDKLVTELKLDRANFIKMDIEGRREASFARRPEHHNQVSPQNGYRDGSILRTIRAPIPEVVFAEWPAYRIACGDCIDEIHHSPAGRAVLPVNQAALSSVQMRSRSRWAAAGNTRPLAALHRHPAGVERGAGAELLGQQSSGPGRWRSRRVACAMPAET